MRRFGAGGWTWFSDPRAVYFEGRHRRTYFGWVNREGAIVVASYDHATRRLEKAVLQRGGRIDDHCNPALLMRADGRLTAFYCGHHGAHMFYRRTRHAEDVSHWGPQHTLPTNAAGHFGYTYPNPMYLRGERRTYLFWRGGRHSPRLSPHPHAGRLAPAAPPPPATPMRAAGRRRAISCTSTASGRTSSSTPTAWTRSTWRTRRATP